MNDPQWEKDSELLARAVQGELAPDDPRWLAVLERRPEWTDVLEELSDPPGDATDELLALARAETQPGDRELVTSLVTSAALEHTSPRIEKPPAEAPRSRWRTRVSWLAAASLLVLLGGMWWTRREPTPAQRGPFMGGEGVSWMSETDSVGAWSDFEWQAERPRRGTYALTVRAPSGEILARAEDLAEPRWSVPVSSSDWPAKIVVSVEVLDASGLVSASGDFELQRSPR